jgi:hypothetical protein
MHFAQLLRRQTLLLHVITPTRRLFSSASSVNARVRRLHRLRWLENHRHIQNGKGFEGVESTSDGE